MNGCKDPATGLSACQKEPSALLAEEDGSYVLEDNDPGSCGTRSGYGCGEDSTSVTTDFDCGCSFTMTTILCYEDENDPIDEDDCPGVTEGAQAC
ncbi:MAG: hypothetical protein HQ582_33810 [Planctomycetes bacterium]|nr:hypothetical protein [Planctomycetota bacterium]